MIMSRKKEDEILQNTLSKGQDWRDMMKDYHKEEERLKADKQRIEEALEFVEQGLQSLGIELALASISNKKIEYLCQSCETYRKALRSAMTSLHKDWGFKFK